jgi:hypothetical protein
MRIKEITEMTKATNAEHRTAHGNPIRGIKYWTVAGNTTLPTPVPVAETAMARDLFCLKYELITAKGGINMIPNPRPVHIP